MHLPPAGPGKDGRPLDLGDEGRLYEYYLEFRKRPGSWSP